MQLLADVLGQPLIVSEEAEATSRGAALVALAQLGDIKSWADAPAALGDAHAWPGLENLRTVSMRGGSLAAILDDFLAVSAAAGCAAEGQALVTRLRSEVEQWRARTAELARPTGGCLAWTGPPVPLGNVGPELCGLGGGGRGERWGWGVDWSGVSLCRPRLGSIQGCDGAHRGEGRTRSGFAWTDRGERICSGARRRQDRRCRTGDGGNRRGRGVYAYQSVVVVCHRRCAGAHRLAVRPRVPLLLSWLDTIYTSTISVKLM